MMPSVTGKVLKADEASFKLDDGQWYKYSKQVKPPPVKVFEGQTVSVAYSDSEFQGKTYHWANSTTMVENVPEAAGSPGAAANGPGSYAYRDLSIGRQSSIKSSLEFWRIRVENQRAADGIVESVTEADILATADMFEAWLIREPEPPEPDGQG